MSDVNHVLLVDDDPAVREALSQTLELAEMSVTAAGSFVEAKDHITPSFAGAILSDMRMPGRDGFHLLDYAQKQDADLPVVLLTGEGDIPMAVRAMGAGAFGFLKKPCATDDLVATLGRAMRARAMVLENRRMKAQLETGDAASRMLFGVSKQAEELRARVRAVAMAGAEALILGAPGSGTSKVAEVVHLLSPRAMAPFRKAPAATMTPDTLQSVLDDTEGGTLFLDEIAALPETSQFALLQALDFDEGRPRVLAGSYRDLQAEVAEGRLTPELYYKLDVLRVRIPSLRERPEDIPELFRRYVDIACEQAALPRPEIPPELNARLMAQDWPGNARALMNAAMRFAMGIGDPEEEPGGGLAEQLARVERSLLIEALKRARGNATEAAAALDLPRKTFYDKLTRHAIRAESYR
ncbi:sigma-54-dependent transcriptional regulator [Actibacterium mucosum]|uniref:sigma-54-dependent transcriptional regulator n=1 Tax=Actibacterium mucosum TaxID=1087332 RepID=UPI000558E3B5|nr:sigma-54 dependent transcriptional regulator [Actibacterium mucosum]